MASATPSGPSGGSVPFPLGLAEEGLSPAILAKAQRNLDTSITIRNGDHREIKPLELPMPTQAASPISGGRKSTARAQSTGNKRQKRSASCDPSCPGRNLNPFPLNPDDGERWALVQILLNTAGGFAYVTCEEVAESIQARFIELDMDTCRRTANRVLVMITEYHLMCAIRDPSAVSLVIPEEILVTLPPLEGYYGIQPTPGTSPNLRILEEACTLRFIVWLHKTDICQQYGWEVAESIHVEDHTVGPLLSLFLYPGTGLMTARAVFTHAVAENFDNLMECLRQARASLAEVDARGRHLTNKAKDIERERAQTTAVGGKKELHKKLKQELDQLRADRNEARKEME